MSLPVGPRPRRQDPGLLHRLDQGAHPFIWTKPTDEILAKIKRKQISATAN
jgi:hypothetical protein